MNAPLSLIDFCTRYPDETVGQAMERSVAFAQKAEALNYERIWYSEHHNMSSIVSSSPAVLISHIGAKTERIRLGSGGVMLPNHSPYVIAEQFGMLEELYPGRIDLGLGRAPGTDQQTLGRALRRDPNSAERFPDDVLELQAWLSNQSPLPGVTAVPGYNTNVPLIILGSSMFGASLAAKLGLPYSFASHFAPQHLEQATTYYRENYQPSERYPEPYCIAAVNVTAADSEDEALEQTKVVHRNRVRAFMGRRGTVLSDDQLDEVVNSYQGRQITDMLRYTAKGTGEQVAEYLEAFQKLAKADELMISLQSGSTEATMRNMEILAEAWGK
ncbi:LLM class flavin-dependent oxidoreductase [Corynebacterium lujinxingii]|uniref:LLM class flavin-dependent oxidoreductase n=1 Tax=Corynebacterium lujinxingii TaxID=2763010 RepID=A0A7H0JXL2_9CORY|nr:LLM class flavin-dependent oxidoreductase [Corynebacterium lujinxingii]MBC3177779.1 LLM class flavin-dependent oxidoreductase [Corynebacterium lujinxingii]NNO09976.1 MsnO8 family LLM class oxidoreductase [Corynebacterium lujinxingii]QNP89778.1 LLM class flavin-dependent oxidoreductase [Corynebacterium lujinxingii]